MGRSHIHVLKMFHMINEKCYSMTWTLLSNDEKAKANLVALSKPSEVPCSSTYTSDTLLCCSRCNDEMVSYLLQRHLKFKYAFCSCYALLDFGGWYFYDPDMVVPMEYCLGETFMFSTIHKYSSSIYDPVLWEPEVQFAMPISEQTSERVAHQSRGLQIIQRPRRLPPYNEV